MYQIYTFQKEWNCLRSLDNTEYLPLQTPTNTLLDDYVILNIMYNWRFTRIDQAFA